MSVPGDLPAEGKPADQAGDDGVRRQPGDDGAGGARLPTRPCHLPGVQGQGRGAQEGRGLQGEQHPRHGGHVQVFLQLVGLSESCLTRRVRESRGELRKFMRQVKKQNPAANVVLQYDKLFVNHRQGTRPGYWGRNIYEGLSLLLREVVRSPSPLTPGVTSGATCRARWWSTLLGRLTTTSSSSTRTTASAGLALSSRWWAAPTCRPPRRDPAATCGGLSPACRTWTRTATRRCWQRGTPRSGSWRRQ